MIKVILKENVSLPTKGSELAVGYDLVADNIKTAYTGIKEVDKNVLEKLQRLFVENNSVTLRPYERMLFGTGITVADMPEDVEIQVRPRSGISLKRGLQVFNTPGTIDPDYRGEIGVILYNSTPYEAKVFRGEKIAQGVISKINQELSFVETAELVETLRGSGGYGSTDKK